MGNYCVVSGTPLFCSPNWLTFVTYLAILCFSSFKFIQKIPTFATAHDEGFVAEILNCFVFGDPNK